MPAGYAVLLVSLPYIAGPLVMALLWRPIFQDRQGFIDCLRSWVVRFPLPISLLSQSSPDWEFSRSRMVKLAGWVISGMIGFFVVLLLVLDLTSPA